MLVRVQLRAVLLALILMLALGATARSNGPAWNRTDGGYFLRFGVTWLTASHEYGLDGRRHSLFEDTLNFRNAKFGQTDVAVYGEYGFTDWLTGIVQTQLRTVVREAYYVPTERDSTISASGLTDVWLGARIRLLPLGSAYKVAANLGWKAPMGSPTQGIPLGTGASDYSIGAAAAAPYVLGPIGGQLQLASDFRLRNDASNEIAFAGQLDVDLGRGFIVQGIVDGVHSLAPFESGDRGAINRSMVGDRTFSRWSVGVLLEADEGLDLGASFSDQFGGRNALEASSFAISATWRTPTAKPASR